MPFQGQVQSTKVPQGESHCRANLAHMGKSRPESGLGVQATFLKMLHVAPSSLGSDRAGVFGWRCSFSRFGGWTGFRDACFVLRVY